MIVHSLLIAYMTAFSKNINSLVLNDGLTLLKEKE